MKSSHLHLPLHSIQDALCERQNLISSGKLKKFEDLFYIKQLPIQQIAVKNCENLIGSISLPVGCAGPALFEFESISHEVYIPLATTEGALVASINRGLKAIRLAHNGKVLIEKKGISRAPVFRCLSGSHASEFLQWINNHEQHIKKIAELTSSHVKYLSHHSFIRGRHIYVRFSFDTDEAMGMNMATIASQAISEYCCTHFPNIQLIALSSNVCTDKKDSMLNMLLGRGFWTQAECVISAQILQDTLKTNAQHMVQTHIQKNLVGSNIAGSFSQNAQVANVLAALYLATGQDPAHVVDGSRAMLSMEILEDQSLYVGLTLPSIIVGTIGGGTYLPAQTQARKIIGDGNEISSKLLAAVAGMTSLAGEISLLASLTEGTLSKAHQKLGRSSL